MKKKKKKAGCGKYQNETITTTTSSTWLRVVVERHTHRATVVAAVLADDGASTQLPQAGVVVARHRHQVRRVGRERAVPDPPLVTSQGGLEEEGVVDRVHGRTIGLRSEGLLRGLFSGRVVGQA